MDASANPQRRYTLEEFQALPDDGDRVEIVRGMLVREPPPGHPHGRVDALLAHRLEDWAEKTQLGRVFSNIGFVLQEEPLTVRGPDLSYVRPERLPDLATHTG